uniref:Uncharacterized protein n=1 Tax=Panagrolaimus davidi TaxID=227884 RepID=A0A914QUL2_9BILA
MDMDKEPIIEPIDLSTEIEFTWATIAAAEFPSVSVIFVIDFGTFNRKFPISDALERDFGSIDVPRAAALSSKDGRDGGKFLTFSGGDFTWADLKKDNLNFIPTSVIETDEFVLKNLREWVDSH